MAGSSTLLDHAGSMPPVSGQKAFGFQGGARGGRRPIPHIDDIVSVTVDVDTHAPIEKVLQVAETYLRQAESSKNFGRPDLALADYIKTNIIVLDIKKNKGWVSLQNDNKTQYERYQRLLRQVLAAHTDFEQIKAEIKADNQESGVQPTVVRPLANGEGIDSRTGQDNMATKTAQDGSVTDRGGLNGSAGTKANGTPRRPPPPPIKTKPHVHPKPQGLHGNAIRPAARGDSSSNKSSQDLLQRFANLRASTANTIQDPRIRTQPIAPQNILEQQDLLGSQYSSSLAGDASDMPRLPDAIYNPARGTISNEAAELPSSAPRAIYTRTNSTASFSSNAKSSKPPSSEEYFVPAQAFGTMSAPAPAKRSKITIPNGTTITAQDLFRYMKAGSKDISILIIDIRNREEFDEGHIMSQATICLEAEVLMRDHISASQIADSMILAPAAEQLLFERRHEFDLVVFYDEESDRVAGKADTPEQRAIQGLYNALSHYDFSGGSGPKSGPKLLKGGLDAWTSLVGRGALQSSSTTSMKSSKSYTSSPLVRGLLTRRQTHIPRPIQDPEEARRWEETISDIGGISPVRTTEEFLRRFPAVSAIQESMVSPVSPTGSQPPTSPFQSRLSHEETLYTSLPSPPTRPPPTLPRRSYSGLAEAENTSPLMAKRAIMKAGVDHFRENRTGLQNPGVFCFANSSLQAMFATPGFARELWTGSWKDTYPVPMKRDERYQNPQLLIKCLANLFHWLDQGTFKSLEAKTVMEYIHAIHMSGVDGKKKPESEIFGGPAQQDAQEFYSFIMDNIHDETNIYRDKKPSKEEKPYTPKDGTIIQNAMDYWRDYSSASASIIDKYFRGLEVFISRCHNRTCRQEIRLFQPCDVWILNLAGVNDPTDLDQLLANHQAPEQFPDLLCETCNKPGRTRRSRFARLPDRLAFCLNRFHTLGGSMGGSAGGGRAAANKIHTKVRFPIRDLDLTKYCAEPDPDMTSTDDPHFAGRMRYDCYAVTVHVGHGINGGHYYSYVQDELSKDPASWYRCNDDVVDRVKIGTPGAVGDFTETMYQNGNTSAYMVYYRRQGT
ncbi:hypothetical protein B0T24DRAFT_646233 [Lasiosphaeria ovina]|uniref:Ubiquitin carboxyl-terminal hydrolase 2 n=1 Tax=Lasiosphaeria ovina TaxID=92902 RepID=A0AAE0NMC8_9PEZI|nr:hypothetical protein B0T24DRAFT_646233 [Lasiosphaeria ovina]